MAQTSTAAARDTARDESYWEKRARQREDQQFQKAGGIEKELKAAYERALIEIQEKIHVLYSRFAADNKLTYAEAVKLIKSNEYKKWRMDIDEYLKKIKETKDDRLLLELNTLAMRSRITRLDKLYGESLIECDKLAGVYNDKLNLFYTSVFEDGYYRNLYDIQRAAGFGLPVSRLDPERVKAVLGYPWSGANYSDRIWDNTDKLAKTVRQTIVQGMIQGVNAAAMSRAVADVMSASYQQAMALIRTELCYVNNQAALESINDAGAKRYRFIATLDSRTSPKCRALDGKTFAVKDAAVGTNLPPMHVRCRSTTAIDYGEQIGKRLARDAEGKNIRVPANMTYEDWRTVYIDKKQTLAEWEKGSQVKPKNAKIEYKEAKTIREANLYAQKALGIKSAEYKGLHLQVANEWNRGLADTFTRFPELSQRIGFTGECHEHNKAVEPVAARMVMRNLRDSMPHADEKILKLHADAVTRKYMYKLRVPNAAYARSWVPQKAELKSYAGITFNKTNGKNLEKLLAALKADTQNKFHPVGCESIRSVLDHEIGHQLDAWLELSKRKDIQRLLDGKTSEELTNSLSRYAWKNDNPNKYGEFIAEAWSEYCNNPKPRIIAGEVGRIIEEAYTEWKKKNL